jgi:hypothetical protein
MHISFETTKFYFTLCCSTCFVHHCVNRQELLTAAHAVSGHRVVLGRLFPPACSVVTAHERETRFYLIMGKIFQSCGVIRHIIIKIG